jgi:hypothetical protein
MTRTQSIVCILALTLTMTCAQAYLGLHGAWMSESTSRLSYFILSLLVAILIERDRKIRGRSAPFEYAAFVFFAWPVVAPYYFFSVLRWKGLAFGLGLFLLALAPDVAIILTH